MAVLLYLPKGKNSTAEQLGICFAFEEERLAQGLPIKGKAFFAALKERLEKRV